MDHTMKHIAAAAIFILLSLKAYAADTQSLVKYLAEHESVISRKADGRLELNETTKAMISRNMAGKSLFVLGEGGSHYLELNGELLVLLQEYFMQHGLKYVFKEGDRSLAYLDNLYRNGRYTFKDSSYKRHIAFLEHERPGDAAGHKFELVGIDFERPWNFHAAMAEIVQHINKEGIDMLFSLAPYVRDSDYIKLSAKEWQKYYRGIGKSFYRDSLKLKELLGSYYERFKYLVTNPNTATPTGERNRPMAENLLQEITLPDRQASYLLDCGMAHSRPNEKGTLVNILCKSDALRGKVSVMNVICEDCMTSVEKVSNWAFPFMKGEIQEAFNKAAKGDIVLFDLSELPAEYQYIKEYGELMVFAKGQN